MANLWIRKPLDKLMDDVLGKSVTWEGTTRELLVAINTKTLGGQMAHTRLHDRSWPAAPQGLSAMLRRHAREFRDVLGLEIVFPEDNARKGGNRDRIITIRRARQASEPSGK